MSGRELDRLEVLQLLSNKQLRQRDAALRLGISIRQVKRLVSQYRRFGAAGLASGHRGKRPNNAISQAVRDQATTLVRERYRDFGPTLACEYLAQAHGIELSAETLRKWMISDGLWRPRRQRAARVHQRRARRPCRGELIQIDGSPHDWFEGRGPRCTLIVFIDDATSELMSLHFVPTETTQAYMEVLDNYLTLYGRPVALYSDRHSIFWVNHPEREDQLTQFSRALRTLEIEPICANTPQAKGRVERVNQTLQDRLIKAMRLAGIADIDAANAFLPSYKPDHNRRFTVPPQDQQDAHRPVRHSAEELGLILCRQHQRTVSKNLTVQFRKREYQILTRGQSYQLRKARITLCEAFDGTVTLLRKGRRLPYRILEQGVSLAATIQDHKSVQQAVSLAKQHQASPTPKPAVDHPWRKPILPSAPNLPTERFPTRS